MRRLACAILLLLLGACTTSPQLAQYWPPGASESIELTATPFYPQEDYQCGPAALATLLGASGNTVSPEVLVHEIYIPDRQGSLQPELVAAARKRGLVIYRLRPKLDDLLGQLNSGLPVLILQNHGIRQMPIWHYAVVVGAERESQRLVLRSGTSPRYIEKTGNFMRRWQLADYWGIVALQPGQLPFDPDWSVYLSAVADLEATGALDAAGTAYQVALTHAPELNAARLGLANVRYASGDLTAASSLYRVVATDPGLGIAALNNLANVQLDQGCLVQAAATLTEAEARIDSQSPLAAALTSTRTRLEGALKQRTTTHCTADNVSAPGSF